MQTEQYWQAVLNRDIHADGTFVYAVRSTKVYCNPSCPSRRPRREHVVFFTSPTDADQAGFRPCRRCQPDDTTTGEPHVAIVQRVCAYIEAHLDEPLTLAVLGQEVAMSPYHLQRIFKRVMSITPHQYAEACRLRQLKARLKDGEDVTTAMYDAGYGSSSRLYERGPAQMGMTPGIYRRGGQGMRIHYTVVTSLLGRLLVAATEKGICFVSLSQSSRSQDDKKLIAALRTEYPAAEIMEDGTGFAECVDVLLRHLQGQHPHIDLPVDVQATAFQWRVWTELRAIPYGETRSYGEIAQALGDAKKARAVAQACAHNPVALVIPCHRVVRGDGDTGGYRWGSELKQHILAQEQEQTSRVSNPI
jgi:AraC family transcriptional regulator of adaptative response/methylated-DNA-[protein]-cysteine methyltransferase